jgi:hypothetical protein
MDQANILNTASPSFSSTKRGSSQTESLEYTSCQPGLVGCFGFALGCDGCAVMTNIFGRAWRSNESEGYHLVKLALDQLYPIFSSNSCALLVRLSFIRVLPSKCLVPNFANGARLEEVWQQRPDHPSVGAVTPLNRRLGGVQRGFCATTTACPTIRLVRRTVLKKRRPSEADDVDASYRPRALHKFFCWLGITTNGTRIFGEFGGLDLEGVDKTNSALWF